MDPTSFPGSPGSQSSFRSNGSDRSSSNSSVSNGPKSVSSGPELWEEARNWFNQMNAPERNNMILTLYKLCLMTKDVSHVKLTEELNRSWQEKVNGLNMKWSVKYKEQLDLAERLSFENNIYKKTTDEGFGQLSDKIKGLEHKLENEINGLSLKITPSANGKLGEDLIENVLSNIPGAKLYNVTQKKGNGDFILEINDKKVMIESKNWTNSSIKGNPKEIDSFRSTAIDSKENQVIDFAIMAMHRVTDLKGKIIDMETVHTKRGNLNLIYVTNLFNYPDRLLYAIDTGLLLLSNESKMDISKEKFMYQLDTFMKSIESMEDSIKEYSRISRSMNELIKKDTETIGNIRLCIENMLNDSDQIPIKDRVINICAELITEHTEDRVTKLLLEKKCTEKNIPARWVRDLGGIKEIKKLVADRKEFPLDKKLNVPKNETSDQLITEEIESTSAGLVTL